MLICVYDTANEAEILKAKITQIATAAYRRIAYRVCQRYESFVKECKTADLIIVLADGADGMEGVIAAKNADRDTPVIWLSDDEGFGAQSYRLGCTYFHKKPIPQTRRRY
mgnify:FL=1